MNKMPNHIKIIYMMFLKNGYTANQIKADLNGETWDCACEVCGAWEGYTYAIKGRKEVIGFIEKYAVVKS